jgi:hypothetical protein
MAKFVITGLWAGLVLSVTVSANEPSPPELTVENKPYRHLGDEKSLVDRGIYCFKHNDFERAAAYFRQAYEIHHNYKMLYNIGQAELSLERYGLAFDAFQQYLEIGEEHIRDKRRAEVEGYLDVLKKMVGRLYVIAAPGCRVVIDGVARGVTPLESAVLLRGEKRHPVSFFFKQREIYATKVNIEAGGTVQLVVTDETAAGIDRISSQPNPERRSSVTETHEPMSPRDTSAAEHTAASTLHYRLLLKQHTTRDTALSGIVATSGLAVAGSLLFLGEHTIGYAVANLGAAGGFLAVSVVNMILHLKCRRLLAAHHDFPLFADEIHHRMLQRNIRRNRFLAVLYSSMFGATGIASGLLLAFGTREKDNTLLEWGWGIMSASSVSLLMGATHVVFVRRDRNAADRLKRASQEFARVSPRVFAADGGGLVGIGGMF